MKKTLHFLLVIAMAASLVACNNKEPKNGKLESLQFKEASYTIAENYLDLNLRKELVGTPAGITDTCKIVWTVSDTEIADMEGSFLIPKSPGTVDVTAKIQGKEATCSVIVKEIDINGIKLENITVKINGTTKLEFTTDPENISITRFTLTSGNKSVATVDPDGTVHGIKEGYTTIKATHGDLMSECTVTVKKIPVTKIEFSETSYRFYKTSETHQLTAKVYPEDASFPTLTWGSTDPTIVKVDQNGNMTALKYDEGEATTIVATVDGIKATCSVRVFPQQSTSLKLSSSSYTFNNEGETFILKLTDIQPEARTLVDNFKWTTSNSNVALINNTSSVEGNILSVTVKCVGIGSSTITCQDTWSKISASCNVTRPTVPVTSISLNKTTISLTQEGETATLTATLTPSHTTTKSVTWSSDNTGVATVTGNGLTCTVKTGISTGTATITAKADGKTATCSVRVQMTGSVKDYEGNSYSTVKISGKWWMAENLRSTKTSGGTSITKDELGLTTKAGYTTKKPSSTGVTNYYYNSLAAKKICPSGWKLPTSTDWGNLTNHIYKTTTYQALKSTSGWATSGLNQLGFNAKPVGYVSVNSLKPESSTKTLVGDGSEVYYWASGGSYLIENDEARTSTFYPETHAFSVRCIKE